MDEIMIEYIDPYCMGDEFLNQRLVDYCNEERFNCMQLNPPEQTEELTKSITLKDLKEMIRKSDGKVFIEKWLISACKRFNNLPSRDPVTFFIYEMPKTIYEEKLYQSGWEQGKRCQPYEMYWDETLLLKRQIVKLKAEKSREIIFLAQLKKCQNQNEILYEQNSTLKEQNEKLKLEKK